MLGWVWKLLHELLVGERVDAGVDLSVWSSEAFAHDGHNLFLAGC